MPHSNPQYPLIVSSPDYGASGAHRRPRFFGRKWMLDRLPLGLRFSTFQETHVDETIQFWLA